MKRKILLLFCVAVLAALILGGVLITKKMDAVPVQGAGTAQNAMAKKVTLSYMGTDYPIKKHLQTVLLIGTDSTEQYEEQTEGLRDFYNGHQADFLMLLVLDTDANTAQIIQLNRDTMTDVPWLDVLGMYGGTEFKQLCLAFNYGDGGGQSCRNTVDAVSRLLFDAPIDSYIQIPMTAIPVLNDLVGGVPVTIADDLTGIDPAFVKFLTYVVLGLCVAVAALIKVSRISTINYSVIAKDIEMDAILAVALGGNALSGGKFNMAASILGAYVIQFLTTTLYKFNVASDALPAYKAVVVIILVVMSAPVVREKTAKLWKQLFPGKAAAKEAV